MIIYWPNEQGIKLNLAVANLFVQTYQKYSRSISNKSNTYLAIDILNTSIRKQLFIETLIELEILVLDLTEINLDIDNIRYLNNKIIYDLTNKIIKNFIQKLNLCKLTEIFCFNPDRNKLFLNEHSASINQLFLYLVFGASAIENNSFSFYSLKTPFNHVRLLFENTIIQISSIIIFNLLEHYSSIKNLSEFLTKNNICDPKYQSIRNISSFRNNLTSYYWLHIYVHYPYNTYCSCYKTWMFSTTGLIYKYIYLNRISEYVKLSKSQLVFILYLEAQDFIIPKINYIITLLGKLILYIVGKLIIESLQTCSQLIIYNINNKKH